MYFGFGRIENIMEKIENASFQKASFPWLLYGSWVCVLKG